MNTQEKRSSKAEIEDLIKARYSLIWITSPEEARVEDSLRKLCVEREMRLGYPVALQLRDMRVSSLEGCSPACEKPKHRLSARAERLRDGCKIYHRAVDDGTGMLHAIDRIGHQPHRMTTRQGALAKKPGSNTRSAMTWQRFIRRGSSAA